MHIINIIPSENLRAFWRVVLLQAELYSEFQALVLILFVYDLKFISICENLQMTHS